VGIDGPTEDFHLKMVELDVVACLIGLLQKPNLHKQATYMEAIILAIIVFVKSVKIGMLLHYFDYFELLKG
jgi:predicted Kef-type K+ transport protein